MYNVLIADDEIEVREGLKLKVNWQDMGFIISGEAANGIEAEELLKAEHFDLLITDMNMPVMDGVQLLDVCRSLNPSIQIMIITGYEDFHYARAGVRSQAMDYLLKPVTRDELKTTLNKIKDELDKKKQLHGDSEMMQWRLSQYYKEMKQRFLLDLVRGHRLPPSSLPERMRLFHLESWQDHSVCFITAGMRDSGIQTASVERVPEKLYLPFELLCHEMAQSYPDNVQVFHDGAHPGIMHFITLEGIQHEFAQQITAQTHSVLTMNVQVGLGLSVSGFERWKEGYIHSLLAWNSAGRKGTQDRVPVVDHSPLLPEETSRMLHRFLIRGELDSFRSVIRKELADSFRISTTHMIRSLFQISLLFEHESSWISPEWVLWLMTPDQAELLLMHWVEDFVNQQQPSEVGEDTVIESAKRYIEENYMLELTLTSLAEQYNYNSTYFSEIFKEAAGISFIQYVTEVRMKHAIRLLKETQLTVWDVTELTGFRSPSYFSSKFKKMFNISPSDYRLLHSEKIDNHDPKK
ncbi:MULTISPECIES: response regulator [unclassified Paenibacillus]|uniref:response regulator n=1 Tax=unclassified Paenibacillus TaxID=185978 RepID=UPI0009A64368|nr:MULTISPECIES: response regulator [unclassified Paenibacillus]SLJ96369.1 two-component system, response regulator YesN [Paenibacillus sp. RU5A]SOC67134.1 two-component system, response regulator YesN [Paenibacillus sp. RU26A]SOC69672.1 two-component system, response regulator YesN [Paenibacillus sp. RU5M]